VYSGIFDCLIVNRILRGADPYKVLRTHPDTVRQEGCATGAGAVEDACQAGR